MQLMGRGAGGLERYRSNGTRWDQLETLPDLSDANGWDKKDANFACVTTMAKYPSRSRCAGAEQQDDGGWRVDFASYSPAAELEWRGQITVKTLALLKRNGRL
jgi:hypothetical protein